MNTANRVDCQLGKQLIPSILWRAEELMEKVFGDQSYNGILAYELAQWSIGFEKTSPPELAQEFVPVAKRWPV